MRRQSTERRRDMADRRQRSIVARRLADIPEALSRRVVIDHVGPDVDGGRFPIKRTIGERVDVTATLFADGHDVLAAVLRDGRQQGFGIGDSGFGGIRESGLAAWRETPMALASRGDDEWAASFEVAAIGWHEFQVVAWVDRFLTWRRDLSIKSTAGQDVALELVEGAAIVREAAARAEQIGSGGADAALLRERADRLCETAAPDARVDAAMDDALAALMALYADRSRATTSETRRVWVDRERARFGAWYELFPRSAGADPDRSGTFREACALLPRIADLGFDIVYLPPIHPIGVSFRKGRNNALTAAPGEPGSPWAIGSAEGGHTAIEPGLGTLEDFDWFRGEAERLGLELALDLAWQCSPDHPWVREHPQWFRHRMDGSIKYAENPPKKYQDIYPLDFESEDWRGLWQALLDVALFWVDRGIRVFRVDNPHTKTFGFWAWFISRVHAQHPEVVFLSEAFTRPSLMQRLAKDGFSQSYTYFTWKNTKTELTEYFTGLAASSATEYLRPNLFANTPDILHEYLQAGGRPAFEARLLLAATLGASYGIYSGFELCEGRAVKPGSEEYLDSEKYQFRKRDWHQPAPLDELVRRVNDVRRAHAALQFDAALTFHATDNDRIIAYSKTSPDGRDRVLTIVNLDPHFMQHGFVDSSMDEATFHVIDLLDDTTYEWRAGWNYVRFDPGVRQGHVLCLPTR